MANRPSSVLLLFVVPTFGQHAGKVNENHLMPLPIERCTHVGCSKESTMVTLDANWRWIHQHDGYTNCYSGEKWDSAMCPSDLACAANCSLEGVSDVDWFATYGVAKTESGDGVRLNFKTGDNVGSRMYVLDTADSYKQFRLLNREITFDVDVSTLACGLNGAVYFSEMPADGDASKSNTAGAAYGTGYCDAQCPKDVKFISGEGNSEGWHVTESGRTFGKYGACCAEMDLWEANRVDTAFTAHPCSVDALYRCEGETCNSTCDKSGCDFNAYRMGDIEFFGPGVGYTLNSELPFTVVTQFLTVDGTDEGDLSEIRRFYVQSGRRIENPKSTWEGLENQDSLSDLTCALDKKVFVDKDTFAKFGGMRQMGRSIGRGMTLVLSLWDDLDDHMLWLDGSEPAGSDDSKPGVKRGPCSKASGDPRDVRQQHADAWVEYSKFKYGEIGSTVKIDATSVSSAFLSAQETPRQEQHVTVPSTLFP